MAVEEILSSIKDSARERIKSPLFGAYILYWCVHNWEVLLRIYSIENNPDIVINALKPLLAEPGRYFWPLLYSVISVGVFPWITVGIQKLRSKPLLVSKQDKFALELELLKAKEKIITQEANNKGLKTKISKEMDLSLKKQEFNLDQEIGRSNLSTKLEQVDKNLHENAQERERLGELKQELEDQRKQLEESKDENEKESERLSREHQALAVQRKKFELEKEKRESGPLTLAPPLWKNAGEGDFSLSKSDLKKK